MASNYVEIFHSKPSWSTTYIQRLASDSPPTWAPVTAADAFVDASHIRGKFRVARLDLREHGGSLRFTVTNGGTRDWDGPPGEPAGWFDIGEGGRYVVEHGLRRVGDVGEEGVRALEYPDDGWMQVEFKAELWEKCFFAYQSDETGEWVPAPGVEMELAVDQGEGRKFEVAVPGKGCTFAFNNGKEGEDEIWDSNHSQNFRIGAPGKYYIADGAVVYYGRADKDVAKKSSVAGVKA